MAGCPLARRRHRTNQAHPAAGGVLRGRQPPRARRAHCRPLACMAHLPIDEVRQRVRAAVERKEASFRDARRRDGKSFMGRRRALRQNPFSCPREPLRHGPKRRYKCFDPDKLEMLQEQLGAFQQAHEAARQRLRAGERSTGFPPGSYRWRLQLWPEACARGSSRADTS